MCRTVNPSRCGSSWRPVASGRTCTSTRTGRRRGNWTGNWSARPPFNSPATCRSAITRCGPRHPVPMPSCALIVTPGWVGFPDRMGDRRVWGIATQLYSVRSAQSWGVGDVGDLADLAVWGGADPGRRVRAGQPAARGRAGVAAGTESRTCRPPGASRTRCTCGSNGSRSTPISTTRPAGRSPRCGPRCTRSWTTSIGSTGTSPGRQSGRRSSWCTRCPGRPVGSCPTGPTSAARDGG